MKEHIQRASTYDIANADKVIASLYSELPQLKSMAEDERIAAISEFFLGKPYQIGAQGEGEEGRFDQNPLYRFDVFDCVTYVNTVIALALSHNVVSFRKLLTQIAYHDDKVSYETRNHFMSADWNEWNAQHHIVKDITDTIVDKKNKPIAQQATTTIDRPSWFRARKANDIKLLSDIDPSTAEYLLDELHALGNGVKSEKIVTPYIPFDALFDEQGNPIIEVFAQIPHAALIEIVRPDWDLKEKIGTNLNVSHVGFAIRHAQGEPLYRTASEIHKCVTDEPLVAYLHARITSPTVKGINVQVVQSLS